MEIAQLPSVHIPIIVLGHLDQHGVSVLDTMLDGQTSIMKIVEFFENYEEKSYQMKIGKKTHSEKEKNPEEDQISAMEIVEVSENGTQLEYKGDIEKNLDLADVNILNDTEFQNIPYMHPDEKKQTFAEWFPILHSVGETKGLTEEQLKAVMETRFEGSYHEELNQMIKEKRNLNEIELFFLKKEEELIREKRNLNDKEYLFLQTEVESKPACMVRANIWL